MIKRYIPFVLYKLKSQESQSKNAFENIPKPTSHFNSILAGSISEGKVKSKTGRRKRNQKNMLRVNVEDSKSMLTPSRWFSFCLFCFQFYISGFLSLFQAVPFRPRLQRQKHFMILTENSCSLPDLNTPRW